MKADAVRGHLDSLILAVLEGAPLHGYGVIEALAARSGGELALPTGTVYPALQRLERAGFVSSSWDVVGGRKRRTYALTRDGAAQLGVSRAEWIRFSGTIGTLLGGARA
ncbi:PadR family transcriptional regulator [Nakamurella aerolata]|uniref:PadR family transcriptional regulator n=1 Tax=Nakamurella aerolata TaxID=1656892 RepID=A0A849A690_9ACTN|nr:helix-turn-helix transcriptional regulator [Nakamurella aerolata]NNG34933.1 PadR family transcriptional regulator [Nakamurella aerolata]